MSRSTELTEFESLRPRLLVLLEMHRTAPSEEAREVLVELFQDVFLSTAWHVAQDLLENGWSPGFVTQPKAAGGGVLKLVGGIDAA